MSENVAIERAQSVSLGIAVLLLYALFVTAVFAGFATYIYRSEWQSNLSPVSQDDGGAAQVRDIDTLIFVVNRERVLQGVVKDTRAEQFKLEAREINARVATERTGIAREKTLSEIERQAFYTIAELRGLERWLSDADLRRVNEVWNDKSLDTRDRGDAALRIMLSMQPEASDDPTSVARFNDTLDRLKTSNDQLASSLDEQIAEMLQADQDLLLIKTELDRVSTTQSVAQAELDALKKRLSLGSPDRARLSALSVDLPVVGQGFQILVSLPTIFLTLMVTIAAGGLGTVVAFSRRYYANANSDGLSMSRLFVNVGEGIAAALAIFLFSGAGMLALTQGGGAQNQVELSPYTVAFIAFLSGFMAEDAFASIQAAGKRLFKAEKPSDAPPSPEAER